jgi:hypothetical protein
VDRSLRRLGQLLVVMGGLLGAVLGVALALIVENAETSSAVTGPEREGAAVPAVGSPSSRPPASRVGSSEDSAHGTVSSGNQHAELADRAGQRHGKADKHGEGRRNKPGRGKGK